MVRRIGAGGMGVVYEAFNVEQNLRVALKTLKHLDPGAIYRLKNEFRLLAGVAHPNLVKMHELSCVGGQWFFVMDYVDGSSFIDHVRGVVARDGNEPVSMDFPIGSAESPAALRSGEHPVQSSESPYPKLRSCLGQLIAGVNALHCLGKVHRDLKPPNVLVTRDGRVVILDFGLSIDVQPDLSVEDGLFGTPLYMAPEMFTGNQAGPATDWYAVGVMLYEALVGELPCGGAVQQLMSQKLFGVIKAPRDLVPETPDDLNDLCVRLLNRDPAARPSGAELEGLFPAEAPSRPASRRFRLPRAPLVGRRDELSLMRGALQRVATGKAVIFSLTGESGIGKSALVEAFLHEIHSDHDAIVFSGRCYEHESVPYKAFDQIADALSGHLHRCGDTDAALVMPRDPSALATLFPVLARVPLIEAAAGRPLPADPTELRLRGFSAFTELLRRLADRQRLVLVIDDLQWSDADSTLLFNHIFGDSEPPHCLLVASSRQARPDALRELPAAQRQSNRTHVEFVELSLRGLSDEEASELAHSVGLSGPEGHEAVVAITAEAKGNPFFISALARNATQTPRPEDSLRSFMLGWVGGLPEGAGLLLKIIAVAGRPVNEASVSAVFGGGEIATDLSFLAEQHFIGAWPTPSRLLECYHDQIRETVIASLANEELKSLHGGLARVLEAAQDSDAEQLASHFLAAGEMEKGSRYSEQAADAARRALAFLDAAQWYERALSGAGDDAERTRRLQISLADSFSGAGRGGMASKWFLEAARDAPAHMALKLRQRAAELLLVSGHIDKGVQVLEEVLAHLDMRLARTPQRALASLVWQRARARLRGLRFVERDAAEQSEADLLKIDACWTVALGLSFVDPTRAADFQTRNLLLSLDSGEPYRVGRALAMESAFRGSAGSRAEKEATALSKTALHLAERVGRPRAIGLATLTEGLGRYFVGCWKAAAALLSRAEQIFLNEPGAIWELNATQRFYLNSLSLMGEFPAISRRVPELVKRARERGDLYAGCYLRVRLCSLLSLAADDPKGAIAEAVEAMRSWSQEGFHLQHYNELFAHVNCALYEGRAADAMSRITSTWSRLERSLQMRPQAVRVEARHLRTRACLAYLQHIGRDAGVCATLERDIRDLRNEGVPWARAVASFAQGLYDLSAGRLESARSWLTKAEEELRAGDMNMVAAITSWRLGELIGGEGGRATVSGARAWLIAHEVRSPERFVEHYAPGPRAN